MPTNHSGGALDAFEAQFLGRLWTPSSLGNCTKHSKFNSSPILLFSKGLVSWSTYFCRDPRESNKIPRQIPNVSDSFVFARCVGVMLLTENLYQDISST
jgi:hypothetical protein